MSNDQKNKLNSILNRRTTAKKTKSLKRVYSAISKRQQHLNWYKEKVLKPQIAELQQTQSLVKFRDFYPKKQILS